MNITGTINAGVTKMTGCMKNGVNNCKVDGKIAEQQKMIKTLAREIGNLTMVRLEAGDEMCPEIMERYEAIKLAKQEIITLEGEKKKTRITKTICQVCGAKTSVDMKYCGVCGTALQEKNVEFNKTETFHEHF